jgi:hypothetical protein
MPNPNQTYFITLILTQIIQNRLFQAIQRAERAHEQQLRRISSFMAREVRGFWGNIEKLFEFRLKSQIERKRKIAMDEHLVRRISFFF